jgi:hypothetical protein
MKFLAYSVAFALWAIFMTVYEGYSSNVLLVPFMLFGAMFLTVAAAKLIWDLVQGKRGGKAIQMPLILVIAAVCVLAFLSWFPAHTPSGEGKNEDGLWDNARR